MKNKKKIMLLVLVTMVALVSSAMLTNLNRSAIQIYASTGSSLSSNTYALLQERMGSDTFIHEGGTFHINQYYSQLYGNRGRPISLPRVIAPSGFLSAGESSYAQFNYTDPITSLIPVEIFQELTVAGVYTFVGDEWAVIIDVVAGNDVRNYFVQVIDITLSIVATIGPERNVSLEIRPLFEVQLAWISAESMQFGQFWSFVRNGPIGLYAMPQVTMETILRPIIVSGTVVGFVPDILVNGVFENAKRNYISNFAFGGILANAQNPNPGHPGFNHLQDFGHFFSGNDLHFTAFNVDDLTAPGRRKLSGSIDPIAVVSAFAGIASIFDPTPVSGILLSLWELVDLGKSLLPSFEELPLEAHFNRASPFAQFHGSTHSTQINEHGRLIKDSVTFPVNSDLALTLWGNLDTYARSVFHVAQQADPNNNSWISKLNVGFTFDVRRYHDNSKVATVRGNRMETLGADRVNYQRVFLDEPTTVYAHSQNTSRFSIFITEADYYTFDFINPIHRGWFRDFDGAEVFLTAGWHYFHLEYLFNNATTSQLIIQRSPPIVYQRIGMTNNVRVTGVSRNLGSSYELASSININGTWFTVTEIAAGAFQNQANLAQITIPQSLVFVGANAFPEGIHVVLAEGPSTSVLSGLLQHQPQISQVSIPACIAIIGNNAFPVGIPVRVIPTSSLFGNRWVVAHGVTEIASGAFANQIWLYAIDPIPATVTRIAADAFDNSPRLRMINVNANNQYYFSQDGILYDRVGMQFFHIPVALSGSVTISNGITSIPDFAFASRNLLTQVTLLYGITSIGNSAFLNTGLTSIQVSATVTSIGANAFSLPSLQTVTFASGSVLSTIGANAFNVAGGLTSITLPASHCQHQ